MKAKKYYLQIIAILSLTLIFASGCERDTGPEEAGAETDQQDSTTQQQDGTMDHEQMDTEHEHEGMMQQDSDTPKRDQDMQQEQDRQRQQDPGSDQDNVEDVEYAKQLWDKIKDYEDWPVPEGFEGWQDGVSPHGKILRYYVNQVAAEEPTQDGAVIVKENYSKKSDDALMAITIMEKREGYDPETGNWFYVKYAPDGSVMENPQGMKLAGLVGKGKAQGCIPCHATAGGNDYLFMNDPNSK